MFVDFKWSTDEFCTEWFYKSIKYCVNIIYRYKDKNINDN